MSKVLLIKANDRPVEQATSVKLHEAFAQTYKETHPNDEVVELDLFAENLPYYGNDLLTAMFKAGRGMELSAKEQQGAALVNKYLNQFAEADKVVITFPMWNFTVPAVLHTYMDYLSQAGTTFKYTAEGPVGLMGDKKVALLSARGGVYSEGPMAAVEMANKYVRTLLGFWGISNITEVIVEGHNQFPDKAEAIVEEGVTKAAKLAETF